MKKFSAIEICAGAGGQALGLEMAGFNHTCLVEIDKNACNTLKQNRPDWEVFKMDVRKFSAKKYAGVDLFAGGVPCPPFSIAGKQLGNNDERDLFPEAIRLVEEIKPKAILLENVRGFLGKKFKGYRDRLERKFNQLGYRGEWRLVISSDYGVPQLRPRAIYVGFMENYFDYFEWPEKQIEPKTVGETLFEEMSANGWEGAKEWSEKANDIAPTLVGGSKKHGGADLGPTRAKKAWALLGVNGKSLADSPPTIGFKGPPKLTVQMAALIQSFPRDWEITGKKTSAYRQVGNAFPPLAAKAIGEQIISALMKEKKKCQKGKELELNFGNTL